MRTLQEKYNGINEGKFTKEQFLRDARMEQPNLVTQYNGYDDAVQILKNRGMIQEAINSNTPSFEQWKNIATKNTQTFKSQLSKVGLDSEMPFSLAFQRLNDEQKQQVYNNTVNSKLDKVITSKLSEARLTNKSLTDYRYKPTNDMDKYPYEQILRGLRVELEGMNVLGTPTPEEYTKALGKVLKNLEKDTIFYTNQVAGIKPKAKRTDVMVDATPKNEVDKENGLKKAALKEAIKGVIKNILSEEASIEAPLHGEEEFEMQGSKSDIDFRNELEEYLEDNQIYGYTRKIHDIMTQEDPIQAAGDLAKFLDDNQIYGYNRGIEAIYDEYPYEDMYEGYEGVEDEDDDELDDSRGLFRGFRDDEDDEIDYDDENFSDPFIDGDEADDIPHPRGYEEASDEETFEDLFEITDTEADKAMVRKFMTMYETEPSKFERLHKQAQVQAKTNSDIKYKHLLSLIDRAKAGALQSLANQDKYQASIEGMDEVTSNTPKAFKWFWGTDAKEIAKRIQALSDKDLKTLVDTDWSKSGGPQKIQKQFLDREIKKRGLEDRLDESVSLKDLL